MIKLFKIYQKDFRRFRIFWRKHGAVVLLLPLIIFGILAKTRVGRVGMGMCALAYLTVPCGIRVINTNKFLWFLRQLYFLIIGLAYIIL